MEKEFARAFFDYKFYVKPLWYLMIHWNLLKTSPPGKTSEYSPYMLLNIFLDSSLFLIIFVPDIVAGTLAWWLWSTNLWADIAACPA